jgi:hypothetical protein
MQESTPLGSVLERYACAPVKSLAGGSAWRGGVSLREARAGKPRWTGCYMVVHPSSPVATDIGPVQVVLIYKKATVS